MRDDQRLLADALRGIFHPEHVITEWRALADEVGVYSPRVDIAVGPFATHTRYIDEYDHLQSQHRDLLEAMHRYFVMNLEAFNTRISAPSLEEMCGRNRNARCFLAIEVEGSGSMKHIMGGLVNAASLGRLGVSIASTEKNLRALLRAREYMAFLGEVGKNRFNPANALLLSTHQLAGLVGLVLPDVQPALQAHAAPRVQRAAR